MNCQDVRGDGDIIKDLGKEISDEGNFICRLYSGHRGAGKTKELIDKRGDALTSLGRYQQALASYDKGIELQPNYHHAWNGRGLALSERNFAM